MGGIVRFVKWAVKRRRKARHGEMERRVPGWLSCRVQLAQHDILRHSSLLNIPSLAQTNTATSYVHTLLPCSVSACPTSIPSTPKMIICLRQIILGKAIYRITIALLCPPSQTSSLECVWGKPQKKRFLHVNIQHIQVNRLFLYAEPIWKTAEGLTHIPLLPYISLYL